jgi:DNA-binding NtrC family response regulator
MAKKGTPRVVLYGSEDDERLSAQLARCATWEVVQLRSSDKEAWSRCEPVHAFIVAGSAEGAEQLVAAARERFPQAPLVVIGGTPVEQASCWMKEPPSDEVLASLIRDLLPTNGAAEAPIAWRRKADMIVGHSRETAQLLQLLDRLAPSSAPVLVTGESGTGKELVARALHYGGPRRSGPFMALNCAAIPESLFEAELFGHERGAFTGAVAARTGAFEAAHTGTLLLDEIGDLSPALQAKLLRVLERSEVMRLGSNSSRSVVVRVVTATNRQLEADVKAGRFREDLYYRLRVYPVHLHPLRDRPEDIAPIVDQHLALIAAREGRPPFRLMPSALERLLSHSWPGNVRELVNVLERACLVAPGRVIEDEHVTLPATKNAAAAAPLHGYREAKAEFETQYYSKLLGAAAGNISLAAKLAKKTRKEVYDAIRRLGLDADGHRH